MLAARAVVGAQQNVVTTGEVEMERSTGFRNGTAASMFAQFFVDGWVNMHSVQLQIRRQSINRAVVAMYATSHNDESYFQQIMQLEEIGMRRVIPSSDALRASCAPC
jgi:hypothetical protein